MTFAEAIKSGFQNYARFTGRARRSEYWWFYLFYILCAIAAGFLSGIVGAASKDAGAAIGGLVMLVVVLGFFLPMLGLSIRRLHDTNRSGWWLLIGFVPLIGGILLLVWYCTPGTPGPNKYGAGPLLADLAKTFE